MSNPPPRFRRLFSCLGCLVAGPLGCLSFLGGGVAVGTIFLPEIGEQVVLKRMPQWFGEEFLGELTVESIDLAWTDAQRIDGIRLLDDQGRTVLSGSIELPPFRAWFSPEEGLGRSMLKASLDVAIDEHGVSNFDRAFTLKRNANDPNYSATRWKTELLDVVNFFFQSKGELDVHLDRFAWSVEGEQSTEGIRARDVSAKLEFAPEAPLALVLNGMVGGLSSTAQAGSMMLRANIERTAFFPSKANTGPGVWGALIAQDVPTELLDILPPSIELDRDMLGQQSDLLVSIESPIESIAPVRFSFDSGAINVKAEGNLSSPGLLALYPRVDAVEQLDLSGDLVGVTHASVARLVDFHPLAEVGVAWDWRTDQALDFSVKGLTWVRRGQKPMEGRFEIELPDSSFRFADESSVELLSTSLSFARDEGSIWQAAASGFLGELNRGAFTVELAVDELSGELDRYALQSIEAQCSQLPVERLDQSLGMDGRLIEAFGNTATLQASFTAEDDDIGGPFDFILQSDQTSADFEGTVLGRPRTMDEWLAALNFTGSLGAGGSDWLAPLLFGTRLDWSDGVDVEYSGWRPRTLVVGDEIESKQAIPGPAGSEPPADLSSGSLTISVPELTYRSGVSPEVEFGLAMSDVSLTARGDSDVLRVDFSADLFTGGTMEKHWVLYGLQGPFGIRGNEDLQLRAEAHEFSTTVLDERFGTNGLIESVFGPVAELELKGEGLSVDGGRLGGKLRSELAELSFTGFRTTGDLMTDAEVTLLCAANEQSIRRVVKPLLPFVEDLTYADSGKAKLRLKFDEATFSLNGDLAQLAGQVRLETGAFGVDYTSRFNSFLVEPNATEVRALQLLKPIKLELLDGRVTCADVDLPVRGHFAKFEGSYGFGGTDLDLQTELPLEIVGGEANLVLDGMRDNFQPEFPVPLVITGVELAELDMSVRPQWFRTVSDIMDQFIPTSLQDTMRGLLSESEDEE